MRTAYDSKDSLRGVEYSGRSSASTGWAGSTDGYLQCRVTPRLRVMLLIGIILFGMLVGGGDQLILGRDRRGIDWSMAICAGLIGSFLGGLLVSLLAGDGLRLRPSGIIGSLVGALIVTFLWRSMRARSNG
jgi:uncharacterized membrane protein YeaQ/YmgE (transglycosylase-associated protein family)